MLLGKHKLTMEEPTLLRLPLMAPLEHSLRISAAGNSLPPVSLQTTNSLSSNRNRNRNLSSRNNKQVLHITPSIRESLST
jgi:hypothetical protein